MKVKDKVLYQIATDRHYKVGDVLHFGDEYNFQGERVIYGTLFSKCLQSRERCNVANLSIELDEMYFITRELAFEEVRKENFPTCPSRLKCMFLSERKEDCVDNLEFFASKRYYGKSFQAIAVKLNGNLFKANRTHVTRRPKSYNEYKEDAKDFWSQKEFTDEENYYEYLFEGKAEVIEIFKEFDKEKTERKL